MDLAGRAAGSTGEHASVQPAAVARYWARAASVGARDARFRNQDPGQSQPDARWRNHSGPGCHCGSIVVLHGDVAVGAALTHSGLTGLTERIVRCCDEE